MGPAPAVAAVRLAVRHALDDLKPGDLVLVACSGGADSLALADAVAFEAPRAGLRAGAVTVDHGLQPDSDLRAARVAGTLRDLGLDPVRTVSVTVSGPGGPEAAARNARYRALDEEVARTSARACLLGHTRDDQAETVLLGLTRGSGARSLAGMPERTDAYRRPLLGLPRATTEAACAAVGLEPWQDPQNGDPVFTRSRIRHRVLPVLEAELGPGVGSALARTAEALRHDADLLDAWSGRAYEQCRWIDGGLAIDDLTVLPTAIRRRVLRRAALQAGCPATDLFAVHVAALDRLVVGDRAEGRGGPHGVSQTDLPGGVRACRRAGALHFERNG